MVTKIALDLHHICTKMISYYATCSAHHVHTGVTLSSVSTVWRLGSQRNICKQPFPTTPACWLCPQSLISQSGPGEREFINKSNSNKLDNSESGIHCTH